MAPPTSSDGSTPSSPVTRSYPPPSGSFPVDQQQPRLLIKPKPKTLMGNSSFSIPQDLIESILLKLPAKSLLRLRLISKEWNAFINGSYFINLHLKKSNQTLVFTNHDRHILSMVEDLDQYSHPQRTTTTTTTTTILDVHPSYNFPCTPTPLQIVGSCNGLLCLSYIHNHLALCNPYTRSFKFLPYIGQLSRPSIVGFGYDCCGEDYKIVSLPMVSEGEVSKVYVYSLKTNSWRSSRRPSQNYHQLMLGSSYGKFTNNKLHWLVFLGNHDNVPLFRISRFDLSSEEWSEFQVPEVIDSQKEKNLFRAQDLGVLDGCLCFLEDSHSNHGARVWIMREYGVKESWTKLICIRESRILRSLWYAPIACSEGGRRILFQKRRSGKLFWYHATHSPREIGRIERLKFYQGRNYSSFSFCTCAQSLVRIPGSSSMAFIKGERKKKRGKIKKITKELETMSL